MSEWQWDPDARVYRDTESGAVIGQDAIIERRNALIAYEADYSQALFGLLVAGSIGVWSFEAQLIERQLAVYTALYLLGIGGTGQLSTDAETDLTSQLAGRQDKIRGFTRDLLAGQMTAGIASAYLGGFTNSAQVGLHRGRARAFNINDLPAWPSDGSCQCGRRCQCVWEFSESETEIHAYWRLTSGADHCPDCLDNANNWSPYVVSLIESE